MALFSVTRFMGDDDEDIVQNKYEAATSILEKIKTEAKKRKYVKEKKLHTEEIITEKNERKRKKRKKSSQVSDFNEDTYGEESHSISFDTSENNEEKGSLFEQNNQLQVKGQIFTETPDVGTTNKTKKRKHKDLVDNKKIDGTSPSFNNHTSVSQSDTKQRRKKIKEKHVNEDNTLMNTPLSDHSVLLSTSVNTPRSDHSVLMSTSVDSILRSPTENVTDSEENEPLNDEEHLEQIEEERHEDALNEIGGFTVLGEIKPKTTQKVQRVLPDWLANPDIITVDLKHQTQSVHDIRGLDTDIIEKLNKNAITSFFPVQRQVIPVILENIQSGFHVGTGGYRPSDLCVSAPTGSGKTLAFVLPIIQALKNRVTCQVRALVVLPVRDLAAQVYKVFKTYCEGTRLKVGLLTGQKTFTSEQQSLIIRRLDGYHSLVDIVVSTPGRLVDHINKTDGFDLSQLRFLVIDEADRMMEEIKQDWLTQVENAVYNKNTGRPIPGPLTAFSASRLEMPFQKLLFSATLSQNPEKLQQLNLFQPKLFTSIVKNDNVIPLLGEVNNDKDTTESFIDENDIQKQEGEFVGKYTTPEGLTEYFVECSAAEKPLIILHLLHNMKFKQILCFTNSVESTHRLFHLIKSVGGIEVREFSSGLHAARRSKIVQQFTNGKIDIIICSDAMARGMDVEKVKCVISYDAPGFIKTYIHRVGRTARAGKAGTAITLLQKKEFYHFKKMTKEAGKARIKEMKIPKSDLKHIIPTFQEALKELPKILKGEKLKQKSKG